jgi:hypothetical protein
VTEAARLLEKHRRNGLLIDSNLFLLFLIGSVNEKRIQQFDRTQKYDVAAFKLLRKFVAQFENVVTTPHVLTEISNLATLKQPELRALRTRLATVVQRTQEIYEETATVVVDPAFQKLGLTDAAIRRVAERPLLVLTDDLPLYHYLSTVGLDAINFTHLRLYA